MKHLEMILCQPSFKLCFENEYVPLINSIRWAPLIKTVGIKFSLYDKQVHLLYSTKLTQGNFMQNISA